MESFLRWGFLNCQESMLSKLELKVFVQNDDQFFIYHFLLLLYLLNSHSLISQLMSVPYLLWMRMILWWIYIVEGIILFIFEVTVGKIFSLWVRLHLSQRSLYHFISCQRYHCFGKRHSICTSSPWWLEHPPGKVH